MRAMNERHGLLCADRPAEAQQLADGISRVWGCTDKHGRIVIPFVYSRSDDEPFYFAESGLALVVLPDEGWLYIDVTNRKLGQALTMDAMPDEEFGGYARFKTPHGKIGFLDQNRRVAIPARYDAAFPFARCTAQVCVGCHPDRWAKHGAEEAECTGEAFIIDQSGQRMTGMRPLDADYCANKSARAPQK